MRAWIVAVPLVVAACRDRAQEVPDAAPVEVTPLVSTSAGARADPRPEAGALVDPRCEGMSLSLFAVECEVSDAEWAATPAPEGLAQEAKREPNAREVTFAIVNRSPKPIAVPLRFDDRQPGRSFSVIAEVDAGIYELASPRVVLDAIDGGAHLHSTRITLSPGGRATAKLTIDLAIVERLDKRGGDAGSPFVGAFTLHVGQLFSHVYMGDPARVSFTK